MKKIVSIILLAAMAALSATAQDTTSTVIGRKLNFESPLFGLTRKNVKPTWSFVTFGALSYGMSVRFNIPSQMKPIGHFGELSIFELRYRPWRGPHLFTWGASGGLQVNSLKKGSVWGEEGKTIISTPRAWLDARANQVEETFSLPIGYLYEKGDWQFGFWVSPGFGHTSLRNMYGQGTAFPSGWGYGGYGTGDTDTTDRDEEDAIYVNLNNNQHIEQFNGNFGFRISLEACFVWQGCGLTFRYTPTHGIGSSSFTERYDTFSAGLTVRY